MIWALYGCCFASMMLVAFVAIPSDLRTMILENCKNSKGRVRLRYVIKEAASLSRFYGEMLFTAAIFAIVLAFGLIVLDNYVKLDIIRIAMHQADWDLGQMEENLRSSPNNVEQQFTQFHIVRGGTEESARNIMLFLWKGLPVILLLCFVGVLFAMRFSSSVFNHALQSLVKDEVERNRRRIKRRYLRSSAS